MEKKVEIPFCWQPTVGLFDVQNLFYRLQVQRASERS